MENIIRIHLYGKAFVPAGWHINKNFLVNRLYVMYGGRGHWIHNGTKHAFEPGYLYLFPNNLNVDYKVDDNNPLMHLFFDFFITPNLFLTEPVKLELSKHPILQSYINVFETLFEEYKITNVLGSYEPVDGFVSTLKRDLNNIIFYINEVYPLHQISDARVNTAVSYIYKHYNEPITVEQLARLAHTETNNFIIIFKKITSKTPY